MELLFNKFKEQLIPKNTTGFVFNLNTENLLHKNYKLRKISIDKGIIKINHEDFSVIEERLVNVLMGTREVQTLESASVLELSFVLRQLEMMAQSEDSELLPIIDISTKVKLSNSQADFLYQIADYTLVLINTEDELEEFCVDTYGYKYTLEDCTIKQFSDEVTQPIVQPTEPVQRPVQEPVQEPTPIEPAQNFVVETPAAPMQDVVFEQPFTAPVVQEPVVETPVTPVAQESVVETPVTPVEVAPVVPVAPAQEFAPVQEPVTAPVVTPEVNAETSIFDIPAPQIVEDEQPVQIEEEVVVEEEEESEEPVLAYELVQEEVQIPVFDNTLEEEESTSEPTVEEQVIAAPVEPAQEEIPQPLPQPTAEDGVTLSFILANPNRFDPQINPSCEGYIFYYDNVQQIFYQYHEPTRDLRINR